MINVHTRVEVIVARLQLDWKVVDFGAGDCYLAKIFPGKVISYDIHPDSLARHIDLNLSHPDVDGDCAVASGLLEWLQDPLNFISWVFYSNRFPRFYFTYARHRADPRWTYACTTDQIIALLMELKLNVCLIPWEGQIIFFAETRNDLKKGG